jgi:hypothetical protein
MRWRVVYLFFYFIGSRPDSEECGRKLDESQVPAPYTVDTSCCRSWCGRAQIFPTTHADDGIDEVRGR